MVEAPSGEPKGLAFVMHGLGGYKEQLQIRTAAEAFLENGYAAISFDTTNTFGESDGSYDDATVTNYLEDLEDVIDWAEGQGWFMEPFVLVGHSLGGICTATYAEKRPEKVKGLAPLATVVSGQLSLPRQENLEEWKSLGYKERTSNSRPHMSGRLKWSHMEDRLKYDLIPEANKLTMPVFMMVGTKDEPTPPEDQRVLFDALPGQKELHVLKGAEHTFKKPEHLAELKKNLDAWIKNHLTN